MGIKGNLKRYDPAKVSGYGVDLATLASRITAYC